MTPRVLIAGIGNIFLADDGFGVEVAHLLLKRTYPPGVHVADFGIRGLDLAYALTDGYHAAILVDAAPRGGAPGTVYSLVLSISNTSEPGQTLSPHGMDPVSVLRLAATLGTLPSHLFLVGCEPTPIRAESSLEPGLTPPVHAALDNALAAVESLLAHALTLPPRPPSELQVDPSSVSSCTNSPSR